MSKQKKLRAIERNKKRRTKLEHQRKLKRKLFHIVEQIRIGNYKGVKSSPLLRANLGLVHKMMRLGK